MATTIHPLHDRVVIRRTEEERKTAGGIVIPDNATADKPTFGTVLAVGPGKTLDNGDVRTLSVKVGDTVVFGKYAGSEVKMHGEDVIVMREDDIIGIVK